MGFFPTLFSEEELPQNKKLDTCSLCKRFSDSVTKFKFSGNGNKNILIISSYPTEQENKSVLGNNDSIRFLRSTLREIGIELFDDCYYTTVVNCAGKHPTTKEQTYCRPRLLSLINTLKPTSIILLGDMAFNAIIYPKLTGRILGQSFKDFIGECVPDQEYKTYLCPVWEPTHLLERKKYEDGNESKPLYERDPSIMKMWKDHLKTACSVSTFYESNYNSEQMCIYDESEALQILNKACFWEYAAFDYETTGIKPHRYGHKIVCMSISNGLFGYSFPMFESVVFKDTVRKFLVSDCKKIAHNLQFESLWSYVLLGVWPANWYWDTMLGQHCLHNQKPTNLKYCVYCNFGDIGYDDSIDKYIKADAEEESTYGNNAFNTIEKADKNELLKYNALDSFYTYKLYEAQKAQLSEFQMQGFSFFVESAITLAKAQSNGFTMDMDVFAKSKKYVMNKIQTAQEEIMKSEEVKLWDEDTPFNYNSTTQLAHLLFDIMKVKSLSYTANKKPSLDKNILPKYNIPIVEKILEYRKWSKVYGTYMAQYEREQVNGKVYPSFNLGTVSTMRSSASNPNVQNDVKRNKEIMKLLRGFVVPSKGNKLIEWDYKSLEVATSACHNKDKNLLNYVTDLQNDMHKDSAVEIFLLPEDKITKEMRYIAKNRYVFAEFYGDYYGKIAKNLWEDVETLKLKDHFVEKGITTYKQFENHIESCEKIMWEKRFPTYKEWRENEYKTYKRQGYLDQLTGFRIYGPMSRNNTFNSCNQGDAYHVLQWVMNQVAKKVEKNCPRSKIIGEIHDAMVGDIHPEDEEKVDYWVWLYGTIKVKEHWPWIIVPLVLEKESSEIDGNWAKMISCGYLKET